MNELKELKECTYTQSSTQVCSVYMTAKEKIGYL